MTDDTTNLRKKYLDIVNGYSVVSLNKQKFYFKHLSFFESSKFDVFLENFIAEAVNEGVPTFKEREDYLIKEGFWSVEKNNLITTYKDHIERLEITRSKLTRITEIKKINNEIKKYNDSLLKISAEKKKLIDYCAEDYANKKVGELYIKETFFADAELKIKYFNEENFEFLEDDKIGELITLYNNTTGPFDEKTLKRVAFSPFFFNIYVVCSSVLDLFGIPAIKLTFYQVELIGYARLFKNILENAMQKPPSYVLKDPEALIQWSHSIQNLDNKNSGVGDKKVVKDNVGLTREDREYLGIEQDTTPYATLFQKAAEKGGSLDFADIAKVLG